MGMECVSHGTCWTLLSVVLCGSLIFPAASHPPKTPPSPHGLNTLSTRDSNPHPSHSSAVNGPDSHPEINELVNHLTPEDISQDTKRVRDFVGKRSSGFDVQDGAHHFLSGNSVGESDKASDKGGVSFAAFSLGDKTRDGSVTKRSVSKRLRDFVGKRDGYEKRLRDFVGKRDESERELLFAKRLRDFVGKRDFSSPIEAQKRLREFLGKRGLESYPYEVQKRLRDFIGKRGLESYPYEVQKRLREFVGKRENMPYSADVEKRLRDFVGKRQVMVYPAGMEKRLRDFVGKRDGMPYAAGVEKRLRDFVGKRSAMDFSPNINKRLRDFVGKRSGGSSFPVDLGSYGMWGDAGSLWDLSRQLEDADNVQNYLQDNTSPDLTKRAPIREFVGKRSGLYLHRGDGIADIAAEAATDDLLPPDDDDNDVDDQTDVDQDLAVSVNKRLRDFVGKRSDVEKDFDDLVDPRYSASTQLSLSREQPSGGAIPMALPLSKRLRDFVGK